MLYDNKLTPEMEALMKQQKDRYPGVVDFLLKNPFPKVKKGKKKKKKKWLIYKIKFLMLSAIKLFTRFPRLSRGIYAKSKLLSGYDPLKADRQNTYLY